ncbi:DUF4132 domain-containing protein [Actinoplanes sp. NPDC026623]|uniref:DUF4132 domain-containing protein n=1 Tax=Actinoplanes sp. NPDC026623 TaxID=3155610 RepID=UPI0034095BD4
MTVQQVDAARALADQIIGGEPGHVLTGQSGDVLRQALLLIHEFVVAGDSSSFHYFGRALGIVEVLHAPWTRDDLVWALRLLLHDDPLTTVSDAPFWVPALIAAALDPAELDGLHDQLSAAFAALHDNHWYASGGLRELARLYGTALSRFNHAVPADLSIAMRYAHGDGAGLRDLLGDDAVQDVFRFAAGLAKPVPAKAWLREAGGRLAAAPGALEAAGLLLGAYRGGAQPVYDYVDALLRGLVWLQSSVAGEESTALLCEVAATLATPVRRGGAQVVAPKAAPAVVEVLAQRPGDAPVRTLARLSLTVCSRTLLPRIRTALERIGRERGWPPGEALELSVGDHGLGRDGRRAWSIGEGEEAVVTIEAGRARLRAYRGGDPLRAVPPAWKDAVAPARRFVTEVNQSLIVERRRVEGLFSQDRVWDWPTWSRRYLDHPITGDTARRLIWQASPDGATWTSGLPERTDAGWTLPDLGFPPGAGRRVRLWHPALVGPAEVARWRDRVLTAGLRQPVKQAFREVYRLTPAEERTRTYSNRFAAQLLHYRQTNALMRERGWSTNYLGPWNDGYHGEAKKEFGGGEWQAVFFHDWVETNAGDQEYCSTDQVRFGRRDGRNWVVTPVAEVPPLVFSEAMRDVDLFVGVTSIATDDDWQDRGEDRFHDYRRRAAFAGLTPSGEMRRDALARLLPRMVIGPRCELQERFLRVQGRLGAYRIHLGSGNILMEPDDAYLCIVPVRAKAKKVILPFDDDPVLSVILSKAIMLAADNRITDPAITAQLHRSRP